MSKRYGVGSSTWQRWEQLNEAPNPKILERLRQDGVNIHWLLGGEGTMLQSPDGDVSEPVAGGLGEVGPRPIYPREDFVLIPRYDIKASAGDGMIYEEHSTMGSVAFRREWIDRALHANPADLLLIEARGDSMSGLIDDGALLMLNKAEPKFRGDGLYVFVVEGMLLVKQLRQRLDGALEVVNGEGEVTQTIARSDLSSIRIVGRVVWKGGRQ